MNVLRHVTNDFPTYCDDITSQYTSAVVSPTTFTDFNVPTAFGGYEISYYPTSHLSFGPSSIGCGNSTVNAPIILVGYRICDALLNNFT